MLKEILDVLLLIEYCDWQPTGSTAMWGHYCCIYCGVVKPRPHKDYCKLDKLIKKIKREYYG